MVQALYVIGSAFAVGLTCEKEAGGAPKCAVKQWHMLIANGLMTLATLLWILREYRSYLRLVSKIKGKFKSVHAFVGMFKDIDGQI